eukprot:COSAG01_NODE_1082_length_11813_cov_23.531757_3_plen_1951_part_01
MTKVFRYNVGNVSLTGVHDVCNVLNGDGSSCRRCVDPVATNYAPLSSGVFPDNSLCTYIYGCMDSNAVNFVPSATRPNGTCVCSGYTFRISLATSEWYSSGTTVSIDTCSATHDGTNKSPLLAPVNVRDIRGDSLCVAPAAANNLTVTFTLPNGHIASGRLDWELKNSSSATVLSGTGTDAVHQWSTCDGSCSGNDFTLHLRNALNNSTSGWGSGTPASLLVATCPVSAGSPAPPAWTSSPITLGRSGNYSAHTLCLTAGEYIFTYQAGSSTESQHHDWWVTNGPNQTQATAFVPVQNGTAPPQVDTCTDCAGNAYPNNNLGYTLNLCGVCGINLDPYAGSTAANATTLASLFSKQTRTSCDSGGARITSTTYSNLMDAQLACALSGACGYVENDGCYDNGPFRLMASYAACRADNSRWGGYDCVYKKTTNDTSAWQASSCAGCMDSAAPNYDPTATVPGGCLPPAPPSITCGSNVSAMLNNRAANPRHSYSFTLMPGERVGFSTCKGGPTIFTWLAIADLNGTLLQESRQPVTSGFGNNAPWDGTAHECSPVPGFYTKPAELITEPNLCGNMSGCTFNVVVSPLSTTSTGVAYHGDYTLSMICGGCTDPTQTATNYDALARFDTAPTACTWAQNIPCSGVWETPSNTSNTSMTDACDTGCSVATFRVTVPQFGNPAIAPHCADSPGDIYQCMGGDGACPPAPDCNSSLWTAVGVQGGGHSSWAFRMSDDNGDGWHGYSASVYDCAGTQLLPLPGSPLTMYPTAAGVAHVEDACLPPATGYTVTVSNSSLAPLSWGFEGASANDSFALWSGIQNENGNTRTPQQANGWFRRSGGTPSGNTGPSGAYGGSSWYIFLECSNGWPGVHTFNSPSFPAGMYTTLGFKYHMYSAYGPQSMGLLSVLTTAGGGTWDASSFTDQQLSMSPVWSSASVALAFSATQFQFKGTNVHWPGDMAVDAVTLTTAFDNVHWQLDTPNGTLAMAGTGPGTVSTCNTCMAHNNASSSANLITAVLSTGADLTSSFDCGYWGDSSDSCRSNWQVQGSTRWRFSTGSTPTYGTGPSGTDSGSGFYIYFEATGGYSWQTSSYITSPIFHDKVGVEFKYHMFSRERAMGTLSLTSDADSYSASLWNRTGSVGSAVYRQQQSQWHVGSVSLPATATRIRFTGTKPPANGWILTNDHGWAWSTRPDMSDFALDDIALLGSANTGGSTLNIYECPAGGAAPGPADLLGSVTAFPYGHPTTACLPSDSAMNLQIEHVAGSVDWTLNVSDPDCCATHAPVLAQYGLSCAQAISMCGPFSVWSLSCGLSCGWIVTGAAGPVQNHCVDCAGVEYPYNTATRNKCGVCQASATMCQHFSFLPLTGTGDPQGHGISDYAIFHAACAANTLKPYDLTLNTTCCDGARFDFRAMSHSSSGWEGGTKATITDCNGTALDPAYTDMDVPSGSPQLARASDGTQYRGVETDVCLPGTWAYKVMFPGGLNDSSPDYASQMRWDLGPTTPVNTITSSNTNGTCINHNDTYRVDCVGNFSDCDCTSSRSRVLSPQRTYNHTVSASANGLECQRASGGLQSCAVGGLCCTASGAYHSPPNGCVIRLGCTDSLAGNFDSLANSEDGSCTYPACSNLYIAMFGSPRDDPNARFIQIHNPTSSAVNMNQYKVTRCPSGTPVHICAGGANATLSGTLAAGGTYIICKERSIQSYRYPIGVVPAGYQAAVKARLGGKSCDLEDSQVAGYGDNDVFYLEKYRTCSAQAVFRGSANCAQAAGVQPTSSQLSVANSLVTQPIHYVLDNYGTYNYGVGSPLEDDGEFVRLLPGPLGYQLGVVGSFDPSTGNRGQWSLDPGNCPGSTCYQRRDANQMTNWVSVHKPWHDIICHPRLGCTESAASNFDSLANTDDGSCTYRLGCTDSVASNFDSLANRDDGSCTYPGCPDVYFAMFGDPNDDSYARFIQIYNPTSSAVN